MMESNVFNMDCMIGMKEFPDGYFELAICDPPYGIGISDNPIRQMHERKNWDDTIPTGEYFTELFRVSQHQIIWGGNYFNLPASQGFVIWDKKQPEDFSLAMCEKAWISLQMPAKIYRKSVLAEKDKIHPTQKPVALYSWLLKNYAKPGDKILDTHMGSQSSRIACYKLNHPYWGYEIDKQYFDEGCARFEKAIAQPLFDQPKTEQGKLL